MKLLAYTDGTSHSLKALRFATDLTRRLGADLTVITVRPGTSAIETPPPLGKEIALSDAENLPPGLQVLVNAARNLAEFGLFDVRQALTFREASHGNLFICKTPDGKRVPFYECFGHFIESLNHEIDRHQHSLLIIAPPRRSRLRRIMVGDTARKLALELHTSVLLVRGGDFDSPLVICADGSTASKRQFPLLKMMLPAIRQRIEFLWVKTGNVSEQERQEAEQCLDQAKQWLEACGKRVSIAVIEGHDPEQLILERAGARATLMMGASLRHDVYRRTRGSLPIKVLGQTDSTVLLVKSPPEADPEVFKPPFAC